MLSRESVDSLSWNDVHPTIGRVMLADGFHLVADLDRSLGSWLVDGRTGRRYLDFFSFFASWALGHNHPKMADPAFREHIGRIAVHNPSNSDVYTLEMARFVATFQRVAMPPEFVHVFFVTGGALAVENALKCAFDWKVRRNLVAGKGERGSKVLHFNHSFHGRSGYTMSLTSTDPVKTMYFPKFDSWPRVEPPILTEDIDDTAARERRAVAEITRILERDADDIAAIIIEPVQGEGGDNHFRREFLAELRRLADEFGVFLIFDEVQCGMGMTGRMWAWQRFGVCPDAVAFGKKAQVCGFMATRRVDEVAGNVFQVPSRINSTWGGNLTEMARARRILEIMEEEHLVENSERMGGILLYGLVALQGRHPAIVSNARGVGLMCAFDLPTKDMRDRLRARLVENGMMILPCGERSLRFRPALTVTAEDIELGMRILDETLSLLEE